MESLADTTEAIPAWSHTQADALNTIYDFVYTLHLEGGAANPYPWISIDATGNVVIDYDNASLAPGTYSFEVKGVPQQTCHPEERYETAVF